MALLKTVKRLSSVINGSIWWDGRRFHRGQKSSTPLIHTYRCRCDDYYSGRSNISRHDCLWEADGNTSRTCAPTVAPAMPSTRSIIPWSRSLPEEHCREASTRSWIDLPRESSPDELVRKTPDESTEPVEFDELGYILSCRWQVKQYRQRVVDQRPKKHSQSRVSLMSGEVIKGLARLLYNPEQIVEMYTSADEFKYMFLMQK